MIPALISAGGSILGSLFGHKSQSDTNDANLELAKYKYDRDLEMWHKNNEYNTPSAQMLRYQQAGLNPNMIYSQGSSGNSSSSPSFDAPTLGAYTQYGDLGASNAVHAFQAQQLNESQISYQGSQQALVDAQAAGQNLKNFNQMVQNAKDFFDYGLHTKYGDEQIRSGLANAWQSVHTSQAQQQAHLANAAKATAQEELIIKQREHEILKMGLTRVETAVARQRMEEIAANADLLRARKAQIQYDLDTNPSVESMKYSRQTLLDIDTALSILDKNNKMDFNTWNSWMDAASRLTGVVGSALSGYNTGMQGYRHFRVARFF